MRVGGSDRSLDRVFDEDWLRVMMTPVGGRDAIPRRWQHLGRPVISQPILRRPVCDVERGQAR
jgi:hypothetical protein